MEWIEERISKISTLTSKKVVFLVVSSLYSWSSNSKQGISLFLYKLHHVYMEFNSIIQFWKKKEGSDSSRLGIFYIYIKKIYIYYILLLYMTNIIEINIFITICNIIIVIYLKVIFAIELYIYHLFDSFYKWWNEDRTSRKIVWIERFTIIKYFKYYFILTTL